MRTVLFGVSNIGITLGYLFLAAFVIPRVKLRLWRTRIGGTGFFLLCGLHHLEGVAHVLFEYDEPVGHVMLAVHMLLIDVPQFVCVWMFVTGLYLEVVRWGPWSSDSDEELLRELVTAQINEEAEVTSAAMAAAERQRS